MSRNEHRNALKPGYRIQWYEIRRILGQGGFGITYLALDTNLDQEVAIKEYLPVEFAVRDGDHTVHPASGDHGERFQWGKDRFVEEARTLAKFKHPNIVRVFSVFEAMNTAYMVMEYERGTSLQDKISGRGTMDETELLDIALPIMDGLQCVHEAGFIHRDVKPANILVREDGSPVLLDFGSARQAMGNATRTLTALVSPGYAPFEQYYSKSDEQGPWTDIYGLGATLYRAAAGVPPMDAMDRSRSLLDSTPDTFIPTASLTAGRYSERFQRAVDHALRFKHSERPQSIVEWRRDFGVDQVVAELRRLESDQDATTQPTHIVRPGGRQQAKRSRAPLAIGASVVVALAAAAGYIGLTRYTPAPQAVQAPVATAPATPPATTNDIVTTTPVPTPEAPPPPQASTPVTTVAESPAAPVTEPAVALAPPAAAPPAVITPPGNHASGVAPTDTDADLATDLPGATPLPAEPPAAAPLADLADVDAESQRIAALFLAAEAERASRDAAAAEQEQRHVEAEQAEAARAQQAQAALAEKQREAEADRLAELERLAKMEAEREQLAQAALAEERRKAEADRLAERQRMAKLETEREQQALAARAEEQRKAEAERAESTRLAMLRDQQACKTAQQAPVREPARAATGGYFAAIAVGASNGWGEAWGYDSRVDAEQVALAGCLQNDTGCAVQVWSNDCIALATDPEGAAGWSWGASVNEARNKAIGFCESHSACCTVRTAFCADELGQ